MSSFGPKVKKLQLYRHNIMSNLPIFDEYYEQIMSRSPWNGHIIIYAQASLDLLLDNEILA